MIWSNELRYRGIGVVVVVVEVGVHKSEVTNATTVGSWAIEPQVVRRKGNLEVAAGDPASSVVKKGIS